MGGIAGMVRFDRQVIDQKETTSLIDWLVHRGTVSHLAIDQGILLNFGSQIESQTDFPVYATADADLFVNPTALNPFLTNYSSNGTASFNTLNADFAVAIWDTSQQTLICSRDPLGVKPLYYVYKPGRFFAFASEIKALLSLREVDIKPNEKKYREYLTWVTNYVPYSEETFYEGIYSVLPGHFLHVNSQRLDVNPYWTMSGSRFSDLTRPEDFSALFRNYFSTAVDSRMHGKNSIGSHLSGGLDSSSVSCMAQTLLTGARRPPLHAFTIDTELPSTDESAYVRAVIGQYPLHHHIVYPVADVLESVLTINRLFDRPEHFIIPSSFHLSVSIKAQQLGCDLLLTGHDGDSIVTTGFDFLDALFDANDWENLVLACQQFIGPSDRSLLYVSPNWPHLTDRAKLEKFMLYMIGTHLRKRLKSESPGVFLQTLFAQQQQFGLSARAVLQYGYKRIADKLAHRTLINNALSPAFNERVPAATQASTQPLTTALESALNKPVRQILNTTNVICNEQLNHIGAYYGHQYSFPFFDKNVIELGLGTPLRVLFDKGRGRGLIRNGLQDVLPSQIVSRLTKANFVEYGTQSAQQLYRSTHELFSAASHPIWGVLDRGLFGKIVAIVFNEKIPVVKKTRYNWLLSRMIYLALWLGALPQKSPANQE